MRLAACTLHGCPAVDLLDIVPGRADGMQAAASASVSDERPLGLCQCGSSVGAGVIALFWEEPEVVEVRIT